MSAKKLTLGELHLLSLVRKGGKEDGYAPVSSIVMQVVKLLPSELVEVEEMQDGRGRARLTAAGESLLDAREWL